MSGNKFILSLLPALIFICSATYASGDTCCTSLSVDPDAHLCPDRGFSLLLPNVIAPTSFLFLLDHRGYSPAFSNPLHDCFGYDNGALKIGLGLRYSPMANLDAGMRRVNNGLDLFDTYEFDIRYRLLHESAAFLDLAIDGGFTLFDQDPHGVASGVFAAPLLGKSFIDRVYCASGMLYHSNSTFSTKTTKDTDWSLCLPLLISVRAVAGLSVLTEWYFPTAGYSAGSPAYAFGLKYATWRHSFYLLLTNSQYTTIDGTVSGSDRMNNPVLGLSIVRKFGGD